MVDYLLLVQGYHFARSVVLYEMTNWTAARPWRSCGMTLRVQISMYAIFLIQLEIWKVLAWISDGRGWIFAVANAEQVCESS